MKKLLITTVLIAVLAACAVSVSAQQPDIYLVPAPGSSGLSVRDLKINSDINIPNWGKLTAVSFDVYDKLWSTDYNYPISSGTEANLAVLRVDVTNITGSAKDYIANAEVNVYFDNIYQFEGEARQFDYDISENNYVTEKLRFPIQSWYQGHYAFICKLPNAVMDAKESLYMVIRMDDVELTYAIRK